MIAADIVLGVELEVEILDDPNIITRFTSKNPVFSSMNKTQSDNYVHPRHGELVRVIQDICDSEIIVAYDATLTDGFELIGVPESLKKNKDMWTKLLTDPRLTPYIHGEDVVETQRNGSVRSTGMHVHLSGSLITPLVLGKMMFFLNSQRNNLLVEWVAGRKANNYCLRDETFKLTDTLALYHSRDCTKASSGRKIKYVGGSGDIYLNVSTAETPRYKTCCDGGTRRGNKNFLRGAIWPTPGRNTGECEIRIFKSAVKPSRFNANLEFCSALVEFCSQAKINELNSEMFGVWMTSLTNRLKYRNLFKHLRAASFTNGLVPSRTSISNMIARGRVPEYIRTLGIAA